MRIRRKFVVIIMIRHVVLWKFKPEERERAKEFIEKLSELKNVISVIVDMKVGFSTIPSSYFDAVLTLDVRTKEDLERYKNHPEHKKVSALCKEIRIDRQAVDIEF